MLAVLESGTAAGAYSIGREGDAGRARFAEAVVARLGGLTRAADARAAFVIADVPMPRAPGALAPRASPARRCR
jgi:hypothetical protein